MEARPDAGGIRNNISRGLVALHKEMYGIGPTEAKTYYDDDLIVCVMRGGFSRAEENLRLAGRGDAVTDQRAQWQEMMRSSFVELIEKETSRKVIGFMSGNQQNPDMIAEVFVLETR
ncbi:DUF2294 family protein [Thermoleophilia bacterium SCSIO 60948]|nr:DUF2294 family protein [Thermoleophilia bacterium SCSIO 60948]